MTEGALAGRCRFLCAALCVLAAIVTAGCLDTEQSFVVNRDLTGTASFKMSVDLQTFLNHMNQMLALVGETGSSPAEMEKMKQEWSTQFGSGIVDVEALKKNLPTGVTLLDAMQKLDGLTARLNFTFAYTDITKLPDIALMPRAELADVDEKPIKPFEDLEFRDEGATIIIATRTTRPTAAGADGKADPSQIAALMELLEQPEMKDMIAGLRQTVTGLRKAVRIETPLTVAEHNSPVKTGNVMIWEEKIGPAPPGPDPDPFYIKPTPVMVKIRK